MSALKIPQDDYGYSLTFNVKNSDNTAKNLTGYTVKFKVWSDGNRSTLILDGTCVVTNAVGGICTYTITNGNFATSGEFIGEIEMTDTGFQESTESFLVIVTESP
jgi:hypothetical protein